jgi:hypothetical protein
MSLTKKYLLSSRNYQEIMLVTNDEANDYVKFFFEIVRDDHPHDQFEFRSSGRRKRLDDKQKGRPHPPNAQVWHLLHGNLTNFYRTNIPFDVTLPVIFSPYLSMAVFRPDDPTLSEFPDVPEANLQNLVKEDTDAVYRLEASIDGKGLIPNRIAHKADNIDINKENVFDLPDTPGPDKATVYYDGYFVKLQPLTAGDHLVESKGYSPHFENDVRYYVYTRKDIPL